MEKRTDLKKKPFEEPEIVSYDREDLDVETAFTACPPSGC